LFQHEGIIRITDHEMELLDSEALKNIRLNLILLIMKNNLYPAILFMLFSLSAIPAFSQYNPLTNSFTMMTADESVPTSQTINLINYTSASGIDCTINSFWAISSTGIDKFTLNGSLITNVGTTIIPGVFDPNLHSVII